MIIVYIYADTTAQWQHAPLKRVEVHSKGALQRLLEACQQNETPVTMFQPNGNHDERLETDPFDPMTPLEQAMLALPR